MVGEYLLRLTACGRLVAVGRVFGGRHISHVGSLFFDIHFSPSSFLLDGKVAGHSRGVWFGVLHHKGEYCTSNLDGRLVVLDPVVLV